MGDHFVLLVDRLLTDSTLEAAIQSKNRLQHSSDSISEDVTTSFYIHRMDKDIGSPTRKLSECRICHDEDEESNLEIPCSCRGTLKYVHRKCVQRWCNEKGDTVCEICHQLFQPGYISSLPLFHYGGFPMNFRGNWEIPRRDLHNHLEIVVPDDNFLDTDIDDYPAPASRNLMCCRIVSVIFVGLVVFRHTLPFLIFGADEHSISLLMPVMLRTIGILVPVYIMVKALAAIQRRWNRLNSGIFPLTASNEENELP